MSIGKPYEELLQAMLDKVPSNVDKREGSIIYDAIAPCAYFLAQQNFQLGNFIDLIFADTAVGEYLDRAASVFNVTRKAATAAVRKMVTSAPVAIGTRWGIGDLVYTVAGWREGDEYEAICETAGDIGNQYSGSLQPISNITGVTAELQGIITAGTDEETDESLRERLYIKVRLPATSGNANHYKQWALSVPGVGAAKVFPLNDGPGTVTVFVVGTDGKINPALLRPVAEYIETVRPIGATVTVASPEACRINVAANVMLDGSRTMAAVEADFRDALDAFLKGTVFTTYRISYAKLGSLLLDIPGVADFDNLLLNSATGNVTVGEKQVPAIGTVTLTEVVTLGTD